jgi:hypothetical protein
VPSRWPLSSQHYGDSAGHPRTVCYLTRPGIATHRGFGANGLVAERPGHLEAHRPLVEGDPSGIRSGRRAQGAPGSD